MWLRCLHGRLAQATLLGGNEELQDIERIKPEINTLLAFPATNVSAIAGPCILLRFFCRICGNGEQRTVAH